MAKARRNLLRLFLLLTLFSSLSFTSPFYVECEDVYPDEWLDLFGIPSISVVLLKSTLPPNSVDQLISDSTPDDCALRYNASREASLRSLTSELVLSVTLLC